MTTGLPALSLYWGLFLCQVLAATCFSFLDIHYQTFDTEFGVWVFAFGLTLALAYSQRYGDTSSGKFWRSLIRIFGVLIGLFLLLSGGFLPRNVVLMLLLMQICYNAQTLQRRQFYTSLLISLMIVVYACNHYRADWTLLFYVIPFVICLTFSVINEQVQHKTHDLQHTNQQLWLHGGQLLVSAFTALLILCLTGLLYLLTPQLSWHSLHSNWGEQANSGQAGNHQASAGSASQQGEASSGSLSSQQIRDSADRQGMPVWQGAVIRQLADIRQALDPLLQAQRQLKQQFVIALPSLLLILLCLILVVLLYLLWRFIAETQAGLWLLTRVDYLRLIWLRQYSQPTPAHYYLAMQRLFSYHRILARHPCNTQEYLFDTNQLYRHLGDEAVELTRLYEDFRYGAYQVPQIVDCYWRLYRKLQ